MTVFPLEVTETVSDRDWDESHRVRRWVMPAEAAVRLKEPALRKIVTAFSATLDSTER